MSEANDQQEHLAPLAPLSFRSFGFVGCGTISAAIIRGICRSRVGDEPTGQKCGVTFPLRISRRNAEKSAALQAEFGHLVLVCDSNEEIVKNSDVVVIGLTPAVALTAIPTLGLTDQHTVLNLVSTVTNDKVRALAGLQSNLKVIKCVPLPPVALHAGVSVIYPRDASMEALFGALGTVVCVDTEDELRVLQAATCLMGPFYQTVVTAHRWMTDQGISDGAAASYAGAFFKCISADSAAKSDGAGLSHLVAEQTPGGLNEQAVKRHMDAGCYDAQRAALDAALDRLAKSAT